MIYQAAAAPGCYLLIAAQYQSVVLASLSGQTHPCCANTETQEPFSWRWRHLSLPPSLSSLSLPSRLCTNKEKQMQVDLFFFLLSAARPELGRMVDVPGPSEHDYGAAMEWLRLSSELQTGEGPEAAVNWIFIVSIIPIMGMKFCRVYSACVRQR